MKVTLGKKFLKQMNVSDKEVEEKQNGFSLEDLKKKWAAEKRWNKKHPILANIKYAWWKVRYGIWITLDDMKYTIKWGFQRMFRGYDDPMVWSYWSENAKLNIKIIKHLRKIHCGYPIILLNKKEEKQWNLRWNKDSKKLDINYNKRWNDILDKMIKGWEAVLKEDDVFLKTKEKYDHAKSEIKRKELLKIFNDGMTLYTKFYRSLWD